MCLVQTAIFASFPGPPPDEVPHRSIPLLLNVRVQVQPGFELEDRDEIRCASYSERSASLSVPSLARSASVWIRS